MSLALHTVTAIITFDADGGNTVFNQAITVKIKSSGLFADLFSDEAGLNAIPNPSNTDINGVLSFWVESGDYVISSGGRSEDVTIRPQSDAVLSVAGKTGIVTLDSDDVSGVAALAADQTFTGKNTFPGNKIVTDSDSDTNTKLGINAGVAFSGSLNNTAFGHFSLDSTTSGSNNTAVGHDSLSGNVTGNNNVAIGNTALRANEVDRNTAIGSAALKSNTTGEGNVAVGSDALDANTIGTSNTSVGNSSLSANVSGRDSVAVGKDALLISTGSNNTAVGSRAGDSISTGASNVVIGAIADVQSATDDNSIVIGANVVGNGSNTVTIGDSNITGTHLKGDVKIPSATFAGNIEGTTANFSGDITPLSVNGLNMANVRLDKISSPIFTAIENSVLDPDVTLVRAGEKTGIDRYGILRTFANDVFSGEIEGTAENDYLRSEELDNAFWSTSAASITPNAATAPDLTVTADKLVEDSGNSTHFVSRTFSYTSGEKRTISIFADKGERDQVSIITGNSATMPVSAIFDLTSGTIVSNPFGVAKIQQLGNTGRYRCSVTATAGATASTTTLFGLGLAGVTSYQGDGSSGLFLWGAENKVGELSSYIPTTTAAVTRVADDVSFPVLNRIPNLPLTIEAVFPDGVGGATGNSRYILRPETTTGVFQFRFNSGSNTLVFVWNGGTSASVSVAFTPNVPLNVTVVVDSVNMSLTVNGVTSTTAITDVPTLDLAGVAFVGMFNASSQHLNAKISKLKINEIDFNSDEIKLKQGI